MIKLGDGTSESHARTQKAVDELWRYTGELFLVDALDEPVFAAGLAPDPRPMEATWRGQVAEVLARATLTMPEVKYMQRGGRQGQHTEHLGLMLAEMQVLQRSYPGAQW